MISNAFMEGMDFSFNPVTSSSMRDNSLGLLVLIAKYSCFVFNLQVFNISDNLDSAVNHMFSINRSDVIQYSLCRFLKLLAGHKLRQVSES